MWQLTTFFIDPYTWLSTAIAQDSVDIQDYIFLAKSPDKSVANCKKITGSQKKYLSHGLPVATMGYFG